MTLHLLLPSVRSSPPPFARALVAQTPGLKIKARVSFKHFNHHLTIIIIDPESKGEAYILILDRYVYFSNYVLTNQ